MEICSLLILTSRGSCHGLAWKNIGWMGRCVNAGGARNGLPASPGGLRRAYPEPYSVYAGQGCRPSGRRQERVLPELCHLEPAWVIQLDQENTVLDVQQAGVRAKSVPRDCPPARKEGIVGVAVRPPFLPEELPQEVTDTLHGLNPPFSTVSTMVSWVA